MHTLSTAEAAFKLVGEGFSPDLVPTRALSTLSWEYIKNQWQFLMNQKQLAKYVGSSKVSTVTTTAREVEKSILRRIITTNKKQVQDSSSLNSSWVLSGTWYASTAQEDYWTGILKFTTKIEENRKGTWASRFYNPPKFRVGKTYTRHNCSLTAWSLMKAALGREGTGAGSVYLKYIRGWIGGKEVMASRWSEQVLLKSKR